MDPMPTTETVTPTLPLPDTTEPLTHSDRCDSCAAQGMVRVTTLSGSLVFCSHHYNKNELALVPVAVLVEDFRDQLLNVKPSPAAY